MTLSRNGWVKVKGELLPAVPVKSVAADWHIQISKATIQHGSR